MNTYSILPFVVSSLGRYMQCHCCRTTTNLVYVAGNQAFICEQCKMEGFEEDTTLQNFYAAPPLLPPDVRNRRPGAPAQRQRLVLGRRIRRFVPRHAARMQVLDYGDESRRIRNRRNNRRANRRNRN